MSNETQFDPNGNPHPVKKSSTRDMLIGGYIIVGVLVTLYQWLLGPTAYQGFWFNLGKGVFWPTTIFPWLGQLVGGVIWIGIVIALFLFSRPTKSKDRE